MNIQINAFSMGLYEYELYYYKIGGCIALTAMYSLYQQKYILVHVNPIMVSIALSEVELLLALMGFYNNLQMMYIM
jgi:ferric iron reductase protein FhuF